MWKISPIIWIINFLLFSFSCQFDGEVNTNVTVHSEETTCELTKATAAAMDPAEQPTRFRSPGQPSWKTVQDKYCATIVHYLLDYG